MRQFKGNRDIMKHRLYFALLCPSPLAPFFSLTLGTAVPGLVGAGSLGFVIQIYLQNLDYRPQCFLLSAQAS